MTTVTMTMCSRKFFDQNFECRDLFKCNNWYPKQSHKILGQFDQNCECPGQSSVSEAASRASYEVHFLEFDIPKTFS